MALAAHEGRSENTAVAGFEVYKALRRFYKLPQVDITLAWVVQKPVYFSLN